MPNLPISGLPAGAALTSADPFVTVQGGVTVQVPASAIAQYAFGISYLSGKIFQPLRGIAAIAGSSALANVIHATPFIVTAPVTVDGIAYRLGQSGSLAGGNFKFAIYLMDANGERCTGLPIAETADVPSNTGPGQYVTAFAASVLLAPGQVYWIAYWTDTNAAGGTALQLTGCASTELTYLRANPSAPSMYFSVSAAAGCVQYNTAYGAWPNLTGVAVTNSSSSASRQPYFGLRVA